MIPLFAHKPTWQKLALFCCSLLFLTRQTSAQSESALAAVQQQFNNYQQQTAQEKVFLHVDKSFFTAGEILWFKAYVVDANTSMPTQISKVVYVEVLDESNKPALQAKIKVKAGSGNGSFQLPVSIRSGNYVVRAYTNWMKNFSPDLYFSQNITIVNTFKSIGKQPTAVTAKYDLQFFPEGGNLVGGLQSKVAFRITNQDGYGVDCSGTIVDQTGQTAATFKTLKYGIGSFSFTPVAGSTYSATVTAGGKNFNQALPQVQAQGYSMHTENTGSDQISITVLSAPSAWSPVSLLVTTNKDVTIAKQLQLQNGKAVFTVAKSLLGDGISHFIVFNNDMKPVCERLYFKRPQQYLAINAKTPVDEYGSRKKIAIDIDAVDEKNTPQWANLSMAVYRLDSLQPGPAPGIDAYLLLNADLHGTIEHPEYYLANTDPEANEALDNLVLAHGWSRFNWSDVAATANSGYEFLPEYEGHIVTAKITDKRTGQPADNILTYFSSPGKSFRFAIGRSKSNGIVQFSVPDLIGGDAVILQNNQQQDSSYRIDIINPFSEKFSDRRTPALSLLENDQASLVQHSINTQVQNAYYAEKNSQFFAEDADTLPFYGVPPASYLLDDYTRFQTMEEVLREYVPEVAVRKHGDNFALKVLDDPHNQLFDETPLVLADGVPFFNMDTVVAFNPLKIRKLDVVPAKYYYGAATFPGIVSYTTYNGDLEGIGLDPASLVVEYEGLQLEREFYSPKYDTPKQAESRLPDFRDVLYWNPSLQTDAASGKTQAAFYTSDLSGSFAAVINGITPMGKAGSKTVYFKVH